MDLTLSPGAQTQTVTVTEEIPAIDTTSATLGGTVSNQAILALPLNGRNFLRLLELRPGVVDNSNRGGRTGQRRPPMAGVRERTFCWWRVLLRLIWRPATT